MKTGIFMDKGNDSEGSSIKTAHFMDKADDSEDAARKRGLFMDRRMGLMNLSMKTGLFMDRMTRVYKNEGDCKATLIFIRYQRLSLSTV